jgi:hydrogenase/urease accessory protein HupE
VVACLIVTLALGAGGRVEAHTFERTRTELRVDAARSFEATLRLDLDALALGVDPRTDSETVARALLEMSESDFQKTALGLANLLSRRLRVRADGKPLDFDISFPRLRTRPAREGVEVFGLEVRLKGHLPESASEVSFFASRAFPAIELSFVDEKTGRREFHLCLPGEECPRIKLAAGAADAAWTRFIVVGFRHIVPLGLDHILFVLALFLGGRDLKTLLIQTGLFTLAHSATLALSTFGVVSLSPRIVEPLIALSIAVVGLENVLRPSGVSRRRAAVVFSFGLLHGLGFAGALAETPLVEGQRLLALLLFNLGVELGQIAVLAGALVASLPLRDPVPYRRIVERPLSIGLSCVGLVWALTRAAS